MNLLAQAAPVRFAPSGLRPGQVLAFVVLDIVIILVAAQVFGWIAAKLGQPTVVGAIVAGILLGPSLLGATVFTWSNPPDALHCDVSQPLAPAAAAGAGEPAPSITDCLFPVQAKSVIGLLGQIALILFMFLVGAELNARTLKGKEKAIGLVSLGCVALPIALGFLIGPLLYRAEFVPGFDTAAAPSETGFTLFVGAMLAVTAFPVMARILQEKNLTTSPMGATGIAAAAVVTILMFLTVAVADGVAKEKGLAEISEVFLYTAVYLAVMLMVVRPLLAPLGRALAEKGRLTPELFALVLGVMFVSSYAAHQIGVNVIVGAFVAGIAMPEPRDLLWQEANQRLGDLTNVLLLPLFLAFSGLNTDFTQLSWSAVPYLLLVLVAGIVGKIVGGAVFARAGGLSWAEGTVIGVLMNCRGLLVLVVALVAVDAAAITGTLQLAGVVMALVTTAMTGPLFDRFLPKAVAAATPEPRPTVAATS